MGHERMPGITMTGRTAVEDAEILSAEAPSVNLAFVALCCSTNISIIEPEPIFANGALASFMVNRLGRVIKELRCLE